MDTKKQSFLKYFNLYHFKFGTKLFLVFFALLIFSLTITSKVGFKYLRKFIKDSNFEKLSQIADTKQRIVEEKFADFQRDLAEFVDSDFSSKAVNLKSAYNSFDESEYFDSINLFKTSLQEYYLDEIIGEIAWNTPELEDIFPNSDKEVIFQYNYIFKNPYSKGEKDKLLSTENYSEYSNAHLKIHPDVRALARKYKLSNLYLVDSENGNVFYNLNKNIALGTNLFTGAYKYSQLATTFQKALSESEGSLIFTDYSHFIPNDNKAVGFMALPVFLSGEKQAIAIVEIDPEFFQNMLIDDWMLYEKDAISLCLIGNDHLLRTNDISQLSNPDEFFYYMSAKGKRNEKFKAVSEIRSCALVLGYNPDLQLNNSARIIAENYMGNSAYIISLPIELDGLNWSLVSQTTIKESYSFIKKVRIIILVVFLVLFIIAYIVIYLFKLSMTSRLNKLDLAIKNTSKGENTEKIQNIWHDELGQTIDEFGHLKDRVIEVGNFAFELSEGKYDNEFKSESENDSFANALNTLKEKLKSNKEEAEKREIEDKIQTWTNNGIAKFNDLLRQSNDNIGQLSYLIIENLIEYLDANQGGIFLVEGDQEHDKVIKLSASYAYDRRKYQDKTIEIGEGLIGNCYLEKKPIHLKQIPQDYIEISSGLGKANPKVLYIVPLMIDDNILGFIELASLNDIEEYKIEFINKLANNIAATFSTVKLNTRTAELLEESKRRANEIAQQEEEMRQNMEEMQATQEELARLRDEDEKRSMAQTQEIEAANRMIQQLLNSMDGEVLLKNSEGIIVLANEEAAKRFNTTPEKLREMSDADIFTPEKAQREHEQDLLVLKEGIFTEDTVELVGNKDVKYFIIKKQFFLPNRKEAGILTIRNKRQ